MVALPATWRGGGNAKRAYENALKAMIDTPPAAAAPTAPRPWPSPPCASAAW